MKSRIVLEIEWEPCEGSGDIEIKSEVGLRNYVYAVLQSNADYDRVSLSIKSINTV